MVDVPKLKKTQWPVHITTALGISSIQGRGGPWHSTGDTTDVAWFHAMCDFLGVDYPGERIRAMRVIMEAAGGTWDQGRHSSAVDGKQAGGNVRKEAFEDLWIALHLSGFLDDHDRPSLAADALTHQNAQALPEPRWTYQQIRLRQGQPGFRRRLLEAYDGRCAVTGTDVVDVLEAAHIEPHAQGGSMETSNGLLLRADLHTMFDLGLLAIDTSSWTVALHPRVRGTRTGSQLHGRAVRLPARQDDRPSLDALDKHRARSGL
jgi:hypothetical protein